MSGSIWEDYSDGEVLDEVFKILGVDDICDVQEMFDTIKGLQTGTIKYKYRTKTGLAEQIDDIIIERDTLEQERNMLEKENENFDNFLDIWGYSQSERDNIAKGWGSTAPPLAKIKQTTK